VRRRVHVDKGGFILGCGLAAGAEFWKARPGALLSFRISIGLSLSDKVSLVEWGLHAWSKPEQLEYSTNLGQTRVSGHSAHILVLGHDPREGAVEELDAGDGLGGAEVGVLGRRLEAGGAHEGKFGRLGGSHGVEAVFLKAGDAGWGSPTYYMYNRGSAEIVKFV
jgi:hypothetical protein